VLVKAYKSAVDNKKQTGVGVITVPYMKAMDQIFCDKPTIFNRFSSHVGNPHLMFDIAAAMASMSAYPPPPTITAATPTPAATTSSTPPDWALISPTTPTPPRRKRKSLREISEESVKERRELLDLLAEKQWQKNKREEERTLIQQFLEDVKKNISTIFICYV